MTNDAEFSKLETANRRILALQQELRELRTKSNIELTNLKASLQEAQKIAQGANQRIKNAEENARNSKERAKRLKRKIEKLLQTCKENNINNQIDKK